MKEDCTIALYMRLSLEDEDNERKEESNSISNQRDLLYNFKQQHPDISQCKVMEFCDDGFSGTNFERPGVKALLEKTRQGLIHCIIVKDFSRFGRNYIEVGDYLEQFFPFIGCRFIAVNENYDSKDFKGTTAGLDIAFKNLIYDLYSKDLSEKIKSGKEAKARRGQFINAIAFYGYVKSKEDKNKLVIDEESAVIVKRIFALKTEGMKSSQIAKILNDENILTPSLYKNKKSLYERKWNTVYSNNFWTSQTVRLILRDERYTGKLIYGKRKNKEIGLHNSKSVAIKDWIIVSDTHEAIISEKEFLQVAYLMKPFEQRECFKSQLTPLQSKAKCGFCRHSLKRRSKQSSFYFCNNKLYMSEKGCFQGRIQESELETVILFSLKNQIEFAINSEKLTKRTNNIENIQANKRNTLKNQKALLDKYKLIKIQSYEKYKDGKMTKKEYISHKENCTKQIKTLADNIINLENKEKEEQIPQENKELIKCPGKNTIMPELTGNFVSEFVKAIYVYNEQTIEIVFNYADVFGLPADGN